MLEKILLAVPEQLEILIINSLLWFPGMGRGGGRGRAGGEMKEQADIKLCFTTLLPQVWSSPACSMCTDGRRLGKKTILKEVGETNALWSPNILSQFLSKCR